MKDGEIVKKAMMGGCKPMPKNNATLQYYNDNAKEFCTNTRDAALTDIQDKFLGFLRSGDKILDLGCGAGRDTKYFLQQGFDVEAVDGSEELCKLAAEYTGIAVNQMLFQDLSCKNIYNGVWACASILHLTYDELKDMLLKVTRALKAGGVFYMSFKYGENEGFRNGRYFTDMTEDKIRRLYRNIDTLSIKEMWITTDVRPGRGQEKWLNVISIKNSRNQK